MQHLVLDQIIIKETNDTTQTSDFYSANFHLLERRSRDEKPLQGLLEQVRSVSVWRPLPAGL